MKKIYMIYGYYGVGGAQRRVSSLADYLAKKGYIIEILAVHGKSDLQLADNFYGTDSDVKYTMIPQYFNDHKEDHIVKKYNDYLRLLKRMQHLFMKIPKINTFINAKIRVFRNSFQLNAFFREAEPGVVVCFGFNIFESVYYAIRGTCNRLVYAETNSKDKYINDSNFNDTLKILESADALVFQTAQQEADLGVMHNNSLIIHNPININLPEPFNGKRRNIIVNFCALKRQKNLLLLIKAFQKLIYEDQKYTKYELHLYCDSTNSQYIKGVSEYREELLGYIRDNGLVNNVKLLPMVNDVHTRIRDCCMFVSSSDYEGISNSMIEAMAIGLPCVCTDCAGGSAREFISDCENGLLIETKNPDALCEGIKRMIDNPDLSEKCSINAAKIKDKLSIDEIALKWEKLLLTI